MNGDVFPKGVVIADLEPGWAPFESKVLRRPSDHAAGSKLIASANDGMPRQVDVRANSAARPHFHVPINDGEGSHFNGWVQTGAGINHRGGVSRHDASMPKPACGFQMQNFASARKGGFPSGTDPPS